MGLMDLLDVFKKLDGDTMTLLTRFAMRAVKSGQPNDYIKTHLQRIIDDEDEAARRARAPTVTAKVVGRDGR